MNEPQKIKLTTWHGGECPVDGDAIVVAVGNYDNSYWTGKAKNKNWIAVKAYAVIETEVIEPPHSTIVPQAVWDVLPDGINCAYTVGKIVSAAEKYGENGEWTKQILNITKFQGVIPSEREGEDSLVYRPGSEPK